jgi:hypothetical protein
LNHFGSELLLKFLPHFPQNTTFYFFVFSHIGIGESAHESSQQRHFTISYGKEFLLSNLLSLVFANSKAKIRQNTRFSLLVFEQRKKEVKYFYTRDDFVGFGSTSVVNKKS